MMMMSLSIRFVEIHGHKLGPDARISHRRVHPKTLIRLADPDSRQSIKKPNLPFFSNRSNSKIPLFADLKADNRSQIFFKKKKKKKKKTNKNNDNDMGNGLSLSLMNKIKTEISRYLQIQKGQ